MKIQEEYIDYKTVPIEIEESKYLGDYKVSIIFRDGIKNVIDFESYLKNSVHPEIRKYLDIDRFKEFRIVNGNLNWNDYDMIFPISDLYEGKIS